MTVKKILYSRSFAKKLEKFSKKEEEKILKKIQIFWQNPFAPSLKTHKLTGKLKDYWSFSITSNLRIMFQFERKDSILFIDVGGHEIYR